MYEAPRTMARAERRGHPVVRRWLGAGMLLTLLASSTAAQKQSTPPVRSASASPVTLLIDPRLLLEATEVWTTIAAQENPVWPGWNASDTPILFYLPGQQDVLINHPKPPDGFVPYDGPVRFPGGRITVRQGTTILAWDGQNTSRDVNGVPTLVVADALSNLRQQIRGLLEDSRSVADKVRDLDFATLATDPYDQLRLIVHEAFHVFQGRAAPDKGANEMLLLRYPVLSVENNVGFALEGAALAAALRASDDPVFRSAVLQWLAVRQDRRARLPREAVEYEDGVEFSEGLAKYTEYRLLQVLEGRTPSPEMWWVQGFHGYGDLAALRARLVTDMLRHMHGEVLVNNDPYGTAPLRMRLYYSGMSIGAVLDRLSPTWKDRILQPGVSLTDLVRTAVSPAESALRARLEDARREAGYAALVDAKTRLATDGRKRVDSMVADIQGGPGTGIVVAYGALETPRVGLSFTPFGITSVDEDRTIYAQVPIKAHFPDGSDITQTEPKPLLNDRREKLIRFRLPQEVTVGEVARKAGRSGTAEGDMGELKFALPGVTISAPNAMLQWRGRDLWIVLKPRQK